MPTLVHKMSRAQFLSRNKIRFSKWSPEKNLGVKRIELSEGEKFLLIFSVFRKHIREEIAVIHESGGSENGNNKRQTVEFPSFHEVRVDLPSLIGRSLVDSINVRSQGDYCRVYVNCITGMKGEVGFNHWKGPYEDLVNWAMMKNWKKAIHRKIDGRESLELRNFCDEYSTKIFFNIKK